MDQEVIRKGQEFLDAEAAKLPPAVHACNTCALLQPIPGRQDHLRCTATYAVPANAMFRQPPPPESTDRWVTRMQVDRWQGKWLQPCPLWQEQAAEGNALAPAAG